MLAVLLRFFDFYSALQFCWHYNFFSTFDIASQVSQAHRVSAALSGGRGELLGAFCFPDKKIDLMMNLILVMILNLILMMILVSIFS